MSVDGGWVGGKGWCRIEVRVITFFVMRVKNLESAMVEIVQKKSRT